MIATKEIDFYSLCLEIFATGCNLRSPVQGNSMKPIIQTNDTIVCKPVTFMDISLGDIVVYYARNIIIAHRVIKINKNYNKTKLMTKGDAGNREDSPIAPEQIFAKVVAIEKPNGTIRLDNKLGKAVNYLIATQSYATYLIYKTSHLAKRNIIENRSNQIMAFGSRVLFFSFSLFPMLLINFLCFKQKLKSKLKPNTSSNSPPSSPS